MPGTQEKLKESKTPSSEEYGAVTIGAPLATVIAWGLAVWGGLEVPPGVEAAFGGVITALAGYVTRLTVGSSK